MPRRTAPDPVEQAADELYGLPLDEFTPTRNERAKQARAQGAVDAAAEIASLAKPDTVAWLANQLVRVHRDEIAPLLELGQSMRKATATLDAGQLRALSTQQRQVVRALVQQAKAIARTAGRTVSDGTVRGLEDTLHAALADERAARQLTEGRLTRGLSRSGFPGVEVAAATSPAPRQAPAARRPPAPRQAPRRRDAAKGADTRAAEREARAAAQRAVKELEKAQAGLDRAARAVGQAAADVDRRKAELDAATRAHIEAQRRQRQARAELQRAERAARQAERTLRGASARRVSSTG